MSAKRELEHLFTEAISLIAGKMADAPADDSRKIRVTVKTPKEKKDIEIAEDGSVKEVCSSICWFYLF